MSIIWLKNHRGLCPIHCSLSLYNSRLIMCVFKVKCMVSTFSFSRAIVLEGFRKSFLHCCDTSRETVLWVIGSPSYIVRQVPTYSYTWNAFDLLWKADTSLVSAVGTEQKIGRILEKGKKRGTLYLPRIRLPPLISPAIQRKNNPCFVSLCHVNPSVPRTPVRTKTEGTAKLELQVPPSH